MVRDGLTWRMRQHVTWCSSPDSQMTRLSGDFPYLSRLVNQHWALQRFFSLHSPPPPPLIPRLTLVPASFSGKPN